MAFQAGTQIRPELANADYSGFANAANIRAQAMMNLGEQIGSGIREYQKNKTITATSLAQLEALAASNPDAYGAIKSIGGDPSKSISNIEKGDYKQRDVLAALGAMQTYVNEQQRQRQAEVQEQQLQRQAEAHELEKKIKLAQIEDLNRGPGELSAMTIGGFDVLTQGGQYKASRAIGGAGQQPTGRLVTLEELKYLQGQGFNPEVQFDAEGNMVITSMGTFAPRTEGTPQVSSNEMLDTLQLLNLESANSIKFENGNIVIDPPGYFNTETLSPDDERYRILMQTKGGQALLQSIDSFDGFSIVE